MAYAMIVSDEKRQLGGTLGTANIRLEQWCYIQCQFTWLALPRNLLNTQMEGDLGINTISPLEMFIVDKLSLVTVLTQASGFTHYRHTQMCVV